MATGLGKTYLAGFFSKNFQKVLFIAHREEILYQAKESFKKIMPERRFGIYNGKIKEINVDAIFASIYTLSMKTHLEQFRPDEFDLIIIDEFHHAAADMYQRVLNYFKPNFLLGITATPDPNDNKDVYAICDGNVAFWLDFLDAIERKWLAPFKYYGVYDDTDNSQITWLGNRYDEEELLQVQMKEELAQKILHSWEERKQTRTISFCSSIRQANYLSRFFNLKGYRTVSLHSQQVDISRSQAIAQSKSDLNNWSAVLRLVYGKKSFLFTGDAEVRSEKDMINSKQALKADVLKLGHHGAKTSTSAAFLKAVKPTYAVVSVGKGNRYGHPTSTVLNRLKAQKIKTYRTDQSGHIIFTTNGSKISVKTVK
ncbi:DEAD/DEAH box helicase family protein [Neobacillus kokaensis]